MSDTIEPAKAQPGRKFSDSNYVNTTLPAFLVFMGLDAFDPIVTAQAVRALTLALTTVESALDRDLEYESGVVETFTHVSSSMNLKSYPVDTIDSLSIEGNEIDPTAYQVDPLRGLVLLRCGGRNVTVTYSGGYQTFPVDLDLATQAVAAYLYPLTLPGGAESLAGPPLQSITVPDVGTMRFETATAAKTQVFGMLAPQYQAILDGYRAESAVGGA